MTTLNWFDRLEIGIAIEREILSKLVGNVLDSFACPIPSLDVKDHA